MSRNVEKVVKSRRQRRRRCCGKGAVGAGALTDLAGRCEEDVARALECEPLNSNVLASAANARLVFGRDNEASLILARQGVAANPANALAWWALANALLYGGDREGAYQAAVKAQQLAEGSQLKSWAEFQRALTAAVTGRLDEAARHMRSAHVLSPSFRPPLRYLIAVSARLGRAEDARAAIRKLTALEPDFSVARLLGDSGYPTSLLRQSELVGREALQRLA